MRERYPWVCHPYSARVTKTGTSAGVSTKYAIIDIPAVAVKTSRQKYYWEQNTTLKLSKLWNAVISCFPRQTIYPQFTLFDLNLRTSLHLHKRLTVIWSLLETKALHAIWELRVFALFVHEENVYRLYFSDSFNLSSNDFLSKWGINTFTSIKLQM